MSKPKDIYPTNMEKNTARVGNIITVFVEGGVYGLSIHGKRLDWENRQALQPASASARQVAFCGLFSCWMRRSYDPWNNLLSIWFDRYKSPLWDQFRSASCSAKPDD
jgi:hypothetical protein